MITVKVELTENDLDLMALKENPDYSLENAMLIALQQYVSDGTCEQKMVVPGVVKEEGWLRIFENGLSADLEIDEHENEDLVRWMSRIRPEYLGQAIKNIFRSSIYNPPDFVYDRNFDIIDPRPLVAQVEAELAREVNSKEAE